MKPVPDSKTVSAVTAASSQQKSMTDALYNIFTFLRVEEVPAIAPVSRSWHEAVSAADLLKIMVRNTIPKQIPLTSFADEAKDDAKTVYAKYKRKLADAKDFVTEQAIVATIEPDLQRMYENAQAAAEMGIEPGYGICRGETCCATCVGCVGGTGLWTLVSYFLCKEVACAMGCVGCFTSTPMSFWGSSYYYERRARVFREQEQSRRADIGTPLLNEAQRKAAMEVNAVASRDNNPPRLNAS